MVQSKDASFKFISKKNLKELFEIVHAEFGFDLDFSKVEVLTSEEIAIEPSLMRPDYVVKIDNVIFMIEFESSHVTTKKKKLFKLYVSAFDYNNNDANDEIIFFVISTKEKSKMADYSINDWDHFKFPIVSLKDLDKEQIINNIETKIQNREKFTHRELLELSLTPILEETHDKIVEQFFETKEIMGRVEFPDLEIKRSSYGIILMLSSMFFDELDPLRKKIQGDLMAKVDCVQEACRESYDSGFSDGESKGFSDGVSKGFSDGVSKGFSDGKSKQSEKVALRMMSKGCYSVEEISEISDLSIEEIRGLKK